MNYFYRSYNPENYKNNDETDVSDDELYSRYMQEILNSYYSDRSKFKNNNLKFLRLFPRELLSEDDCVKASIDNIWYYLSWNIKPSNLVFGINNNYQKKTFSQKELDNLSKIEKVAKKFGVTVGVFDYEDVFTYNEVANADRIIKENVSEINKHNFSTLEKLLYAYLLVSAKLYNKEIEEKESSSQSRSIYGVLNSDKIVCTGFANYLKAISKELNDNNLKVFSNFVKTKIVENNANTKFGLHENNIVYIKDDKYKIDGFYYLDPTWDSIKNGKNLLSYFLLEIGQIKSNLDKQIIDYFKDKKQVDFNEEPQRNVKHKDNFLNNYSFVKYASVSQDKLDFGPEKFLFNDDTITDELLSKYLMTRQDFKDYILLKETMNNFKHSNMPFDKFLEKNSEIIKNDILETKIINNHKDLFKYLKQHSPHVDIGTIQNALQTVFSSTNPDKTKDEISKMVYNTLKSNIIEGKETFNGNQTMWTECEELK